MSMSYNRRKNESRNSKFENVANDDFWTLFISENTVLNSKLTHLSKSCFFAACLICDSSVTAHSLCLTYTYILRYMLCKVARCYRTLRLPTQCPCRMITWRPHCTALAACTFGLTQKKNVRTDWRPHQATTTSIKTGRPRPSAFLTVQSTRRARPAAQAPAMVLLIYNNLLSGYLLSRSGYSSL